MPLRTPLYESHLAAGAKMVDFSGWEMPIHYGSQIEEHHAVRRDAGMFDVSHMCVVDLRGVRVREYLRRLLANDVAKLVEPGKALYSCLLDENGGVLDDLIVYFVAAGARCGRRRACRSPRSPERTARPRLRTSCRVCSVRRGCGPD